MRNVCTALVLFAATLWLASASAWATDEIAFIDMDRVFSEYAKTKSAEGRLKEQARMFKAETEERVEDLRTLEEDFNLARQEAQDMALSEEIRKQRRGEAEDKLVKMREMENEIRAFRDARRKELEDTSRRLREGIVDEITGVLNAFAAEREFLAVIDSSGNSFNQIPVILYHREGLDITGEILDQLNAAGGSQED